MRKLSLIIVFTAGVLAATSNQGKADDESHRDHFHLDNGTYFGLTKFKCIAGPTNEKRP